MTLKHKQRGFSPLVILLILLLLAVLGFVGWRFWSNRSTTPPASSAAPATASPSTAPASTPTYATAESGAFRVILPDTWVSDTCADSPDLLFLAPSTDKLGKCQSESGGTVLIAKNSGDLSHPESYYTSDSYYGSVSYSDLTVDGIAGHKVSYTIASTTEINYPPVGTEQTIYTFYDGSDTYSIIYTRFAGDPDLSTTVQSLAESFDKI